MGDGLPIPSDDGYPKGFLGKFKNGGGEEADGWYLEGRITGLRKKLKKNLHSSADQNPFSIYSLV